MRVLVTGGAGFIGSNLVKEITKRYPNWEVFVMDDFSSGTFKNLIGFNGEIITASLEDKEALESLSKYNFDLIFHQGANANTTEVNQKKVMEVNYESFKYLLKLAKEGASLIYASSGAVYGNTPPPMKVYGELKPENVYGFSKYAMDMLTLKFLRENPSAKVVGLRYFNVYGPGETHKGKMASMVLQLTVQILKGKKPRLFKWGEQKRDFVYVKDCVEANLRALNATKSGIVNIGTGRARSFNEVISIIKETLKTDVDVEYFDNPYDFYQNYTEADLTETEKLLGWKPSIQIEDGIPEYVNWIKENVNWKKLPY